MSSDPGGAPEKKSLSPTSLREMVVAILAGMVVSYLALGGFDLSGKIVPITPWSLAGTLVVLAAGAAYYAWMLRGRVRNDRASISPEEGVRALVLGKVMLLGGCLLIGWHIVYVLKYLGRFDVPAPQERVVHGTGTIVAAVLFAAAGWLLERACIVPGAPRDESDSQSGRNE